MKTRFAMLVGALVLLAGLLLVPASLADRGMIRPIGPPIDLSEPAQRALIAHNGARELLILQTEVQSDREAKVVEFMPLPAKPEVSLAPKDCFESLQEIIRAHGLRYLVPRMMLEGKAAARGAESEAITVVVSAQLGPHDVTVVQVRQPEEFTRWVEQFFRDKGLGRPAMTDELREIVSDYVRREICFFAFDVIALSPGSQTVQPLAYDFACDHFYYPLKVTNLYGGRGTIELLTLLPTGSRGFESIEIRPVLPGPVPLARPEPAGEPERIMPIRVPPWRLLRSTAADLSRSELERLHRELPAMMRDQPATLRALKYEGPLHFDCDISVPTYIGERPILLR